MLQAILFLLIVVAGTGGELCISRSMKSIGEIHDFRPRSLIQFVRAALRLRWTQAGVALMALGFFSLVVVLSFDEVSFVVPFTALSYVAGALGARVFLGERISRHRWLGIATVALGVTIVWWSKR
jgi:drug/metabolite transporter (DMT)-like permease